MFEKQIPMQYYPKLKDNISLRNYGNNEFIINLQSGKSEKISEEAYDVYNLSNGELSVNDIISQLNKKYDFNVSDLEFFFKEAINRQIISLEISKLNEKGKTIVFNNFYPLHVSYLPTTGCNLNCNYCYGDFSAKTNEIAPLAKIKTLFNFLKSVGINSIELSGGEPLYHPDFYEILSLSLKLFKYTAILSNGVLFNDKIIDLLKQNNGKYGIQISIDGFSSQTNDKVRGKQNTWPRTVENIKKLIELKAPLRIGYIITQDNYSELGQAVELMRFIGVKDIALSVAEGIGRGKDLLYPDQNPMTFTDSPYFAPIKDSIEQVARNNEDLILTIKRVRNFENFNNQDKNCGAGHRSITILPSGDFIPCPMMNDKKFILGNIFNKIQIEKYFNPENNQYSFFRNFLKKVSDNDCCDCVFENYCGSCLLRIINSNQKIFKKEKTFCKYVKNNNIEQIVSAYV